MRAHTLLKTAALSCKFTKLGNLNTCSDRWLITVVLSAEQTVLVRKKASVSTVSLQLDKGQTLIWPLFFFLMKLYATCAMDT